MKIRSFLTAVSMTALMAGAAHADPLGIRIVDVDDNPGNGQEDNNGANTDVNLLPVLIANEVNDDVIENVRFEIEIFDDVNGMNKPNGQNFTFGDVLDIEVNLGDGLTFGSTFQSDDITVGTDRTNPGGAITSIAGSVVSQSDKQLIVGATVTPEQKTIGLVMYLDIDPAMCSGKSTEELPISIGVTRDQPNPGGVDSTTPEFGGPTTVALLKCTDGIVASVTSDEFGFGTDTMIDLPTYTTFAVNPDSGPTLGAQDFEGVFDTGASNGRLGWVSFSVNEAAVTEFNTTSTESGGPDENELMSSDLVATVGWDVMYSLKHPEGDIDTGGLSGTLVNTSIPGPNNDFSTFEPVNASTGMSSFSWSGSQAAGVVDASRNTMFVFSDGGPEDIEEQNTKTVDSFITFTRTYLASEGGEELCGDGPLDMLQRQGRRFGFFDWVGDASKPTANIFRVTGLSNTEDTKVDVVFDNSKAGQDGTFTLKIPAADVMNGNYVIGSDTQLEALNPGHNISDIQFFFKTRNRDLDVDRLQIDGDGALNDFGDGSNFSINLLSPERTPSLDGDQELGSE